VQTICIVDDNEDIIEIFSVYFRKQGYSVLVASDGQGCIDAIQTFVPDIILLDVMMEPMDGWQTLEQIKNNPRTMDIPVIMVSGKRPTHEELQVYGKSFVNYVMKPVSFPMLREAVTRVLEERTKVIH
jgi:two-component system OmpR family response regulator